MTREKAIIGRLVTYIIERRTSQSERDALYSDLFDIRGRACAVAGTVLIRAYSADSRTDPVEIKRACQDLLKDYRKPNATTSHVPVCIATIIIMILLLIGLLIASMNGKTVPASQHWIVSLLMSIFAATLVMAGTGTATVDARIKLGEGGKIAIRLGGAAAAFVGTFAIFTKINY
jgi:hypothetical protein